MRLILFTRYPLAGSAKTRLIQALGAEGAAALQRRLTLRAVRAAEALAAKLEVSFEIHFDGANEPAMRHWLGDRFDFCQQSSGDLGQRMAAAFEKSFQEGSTATVIIGADCPELTLDVLAEAFAKLQEVPVVLGPATDGGYYLIGLQRLIPELFLGLEWGSSSVLADSLRIIQKTGKKAVLLQPLDDIDRPEDVTKWRRMTKLEESDLEKVSIIIPALNEEESIGSTIAWATAENPLEVLVVDGGSTDKTAEAARAAGTAIVRSGPGRARQLNAGASKASGNVLLFLHADTRLPRGYRSSVATAFKDPATAAGAFRFSIEERFRGSKFIEFTANLRSRWLQMPYGDQGLFLRRSLFEELGGFADLPIMEDYELVRRLRRRGRVITLRDSAMTSGRRWRQLGLWRTTLINTWMVLGYHLGTPVEKLATLYRHKNSRCTAQ
jgi:rSAM/selenodomain-associated transferase 2/rSAM/selenodomain-associated transferase 1